MTFTPSVSRARRQVTLLAFRRAARESTSAAPELREFTIKAAEIVVGRGGSKRGDPAFFALFEQEVSRAHGRFSRRTDGWYYTDLHSANGTWYNDRQVLDRNVGPVCVGDTFAFGDREKRWIVVESHAAVLPRVRSTESTQPRPERAPLGELCLEVVRGTPGDAGPSVTVRLGSGSSAVELAFPESARRARELLALLADARNRRGEHDDAGWVSRKALVEAMGWDEGSKAFNSCLALIRRHLLQHAPSSKLADALIEDRKRGTATYYRLAIRTIIVPAPRR